jgi:DNA-binding MarR family transcriptional regulator
MKRVQLIARNLKKISHLYTKVLLKELSENKLDQYFEVILLLNTQKEPITQNKLAELMQVDKSRMANIIFYLEKRNLIYIERNPADRRQHYVYLSSTAKKSIPAIEKTVKKINEIAEEGITSEKLTVFFEVSEMIQQNLQKNISFSVLSS